MAIMSNIRLSGLVAFLCVAVAAEQPDINACSRDDEACVLQPLAAQRTIATGLHEDLGIELLQRGGGVSWLQAKASNRPKAVSQAEVASAAARRGEEEVQSHPDSMYCFMVVMSTGYEVDLLKFFHDTSTSIFACPGQTVFSNAGEVGGLPVVNVGSLEAPQLWWDHDGHLGLSKVFYKVWNKLISLGTYKDFSWTLKVDPDAVFVPARLAQHVVNRDPKQPHVFGCIIQMWGAVEVMSLGAMELYAKKGSEVCGAFLEEDGYVESMGEDAWVTRCMDTMGVPRHEDEFLIGYRKLGFSECTGHRALVYHDYKTVDDYKECLDNMTAADAAAAAAA